MKLEYEARKPKDLKKINNKDFGEMLWWSYILGVTLEKLLTTVDQFGTATEQVKKHVKD